MVLLIAISVPIMLGIETLLRVYVLGPLYGPVLTELRGIYWPELTDEIIATRATNTAWILIGVTVVAGCVGIALLRWVIRRASAATGEQPTPNKIRDSLLLLTSIPQVPGLLSTLCLAGGGELLPVLICVGVSTSFVVVQGFVGERAIEAMGPAAAAC
ncbi:hypothetical protein DB30_04993 [Enhygromyxa salina]|uniref:ABC transmembrane type-1 domain-containing protein n=1 Tax=Enhygromyxa salina TaxID=215803 RepID=A0A0C2CYS3_9BACT|nr:hypothetical protein DB30_04993 [Enhygromyxa salina]